jgi:hypothetical protein
MPRRATPRTAASSPRPPLAEPALAPLIDRARRIEALDRSLRDALPPTLAPHCRLANVRESHLVFVTRTPAVAQRLRLEAATLLDRARLVTGKAFGELTIKVARRWDFDRATEPAEGAPLTATAAAHIGAAASILDDPDLRDQLRRLASLA